MNRRQRQYVHRANAALMDIMTEGANAFGQIFAGKRPEDMQAFRDRVALLSQVYCDNIIGASHEAYIAFNSAKAQSSVKKPRSTKSR